MPPNSRFGHVCFHYEAQVEYNCRCDGGVLVGRFGTLSLLRILASESLDRMLQYRRRHYDEIAARVICELRMILRELSHRSPTPVGDILLYPRIECFAGPLNALLISNSNPDRDITVTAHHDYFFYSGLTRPKVR